MFPSIFGGSSTPHFDQHFGQSFVEWPPSASASCDPAFEELENRYRAGLEEGLRESIPGACFDSEPSQVVIRGMGRRLFRLLEVLHPLVPAQIWDRICSQPDASILELVGEKTLGAKMVDRGCVRLVVPALPHIEPVVKEWMLRWSREASGVLTTEKACEALDVLAAEHPEMVQQYLEPVINSPEIPLEGYPSILKSFAQALGNPRQPEDTLTMLLDEEKLRAIGLQLSFSNHQNVRYLTAFFRGVGQRALSSLPGNDLTQGCRALLEMACELGSELVAYAERSLGLKGDCCAQRFLLDLSEPVRRPISSNGVPMTPTPFPGMDQPDRAEGEEGSAALELEEPERLPQGRESPSELTETGDPADLSSIERVCRTLGALTRKAIVLKAISFSPEARDYWRDELARRWQKVMHFGVADPRWVQAVMTVQPVKGLEGKPPLDETARLLRAARIQSRALPERVEGSSRPLWRPPSSTGELIQDVLALADLTMCEFIPGYSEWVRAALQNRPFSPKMWFSLHHVLLRQKWPDQVSEESANQLRNLFSPFLKEVPPDLPTPPVALQLQDLIGWRCSDEQDYYRWEEIDWYLRTAESERMLRDAAARVEPERLHEQKVWILAMALNHLMLCGYFAARSRFMRQKFCAAYRESLDAQRGGAAPSSEP